MQSDPSHTHADATQQSPSLPDVSLSSSVMERSQSLPAQRTTFSCNNTGRLPASKQQGPYAAHTTPTASLTEKERDSTQANFQAAKLAQAKIDAISAQADIDRIIEQHRINQIVDQDTQEMIDKYTGLISPRPTHATSVSRSGATWTQPQTTMPATGLAPLNSRRPDQYSHGHQQPGQEPYRFQQSSATFGSRRGAGPCSQQLRR